MIIKKVEVKKLLGLDDVSLNFEDKEVPIIFGYNGCGKTSILRLIKAVINLELDVLIDIEFEEIKIYTEDRILTIYKNPLVNNLPREKNLMRRTKSSRRILEYKIESILGEKIIKVILTRRNIIDVNKMMKLNNSNRYDELFNKNRMFDDEFYFNIKNEMSNERLIKLVKELEEIKGEGKIEFISASRLVTIKDSEEINMVAKCSENIAGMLGVYANLFSEKSQELDRLFPNNVISAMRNKTEYSNEEVEKLLNKMNELNLKRNELTQMGLLANNINNVPIPEKSELDVSMINILALYINDSYKKLEIFDEIKTELTLFLELINENTKFYRKKMIMSKEAGIHFQSSDGRDFDVRKLSSGEKNIIVLFYELLFNADKNTIIMIDEPEISLHIEWQENFVKNILKINEIVGAKVIIATHSPDIVGKYDDWTSEMGGEFDGN